MVRAACIILLLLLPNEPDELTAKVVGVIDGGAE
jgi:hypothetical protein